MGPVSCISLLPFATGGSRSLREEKHRTLFLQLLEQTAHTFGFEVRGVAVEPDRFHLLMTEPAKDTADHAVEIFRRRYGRRYNSSARTDEQVWETKWTDAHVVGEEALGAAGISARG